MKHDIEFKKGEKYWIDEEVYGKKYKVTLKHFWKETMIYGLVFNDEGYEWETMLNRLTEIKKQEIETRSFYKGNSFNLKHI